MVDSRKVCRTIKRKLDAMSEEELVAFYKRMGFVLKEKDPKPKGRVVRVRRSSVRVRKNED